MKLIKINTDHYVVVDDSEIQEGNWVLPIDNIPYQIKNKEDVLNFDKKITHSTQPLDKSLFFTDRVWGCERLSLGEVKELIGEVDVDKRIYDTDFRGDVNSYKNGYNQALEDNKEKKYTEAQMRECWRASERFDRSYNEGYAPNFEEFIQSLQPKTEWEVEFRDGKLKLI